MRSVGPMDWLTA
jgi:hypothetical protein